MNYNFNIVKYEVIKKSITPRYLNENKSFLMIMKSNYESEKFICNNLQCENCFTNWCTLNDKEFTIHDYNRELYQVIKDLLI